MPSKDISDKQLKAMQLAHVNFRKGEGANRIVAASKIKEYCKALGHRCEGGLPEDLADRVYKMLWAAIGRCDGNNRNTVKDVDL